MITIKKFSYKSIRLISRNMKIIGLLLMFLMTSSVYGLPNKTNVNSEINQNGDSIIQSSLKHEDIQTGVNAQFDREQQSIYENMEDNRSEHNKDDHIKSDNPIRSSLHSIRVSGFIDLNSYTIHDPIYIDGNFSATATAESWSGDGTIGNPYIIEGYEISGNDVSTPIYIRNENSYFIVRNNLIHNSVGHGVYLYLTDNGMIENNTIYNNGNLGMYIHTSNSNTFLQNQIFNNTGSGMYVYNSVNNQINDNQIFENNVYGVLVYGNSLDNTLQLNDVFENGHNGIFVDNSDSTIIEDNIISTNGWDGIQISQGLLTTIENNTITESTASGIALLGSSNNSIVQMNNIFYNYQVGIYISASHHSTITDNEISDNVIHGIQLVSTTQNTIENNNMTNDGIYITANDESGYQQTSFANNLVNSKPVEYLDGVSGITVPSDYGQLIIVNSNNLEITGHSIVGMENPLIVGFSHHINIHNNIYDKSSGYGIVLSHTNSSIVKDNQISNSTYDGLFIQLHSYNNVIENNNVFDNRRGIFLHTSFDSIVTSNEIDNNRWDTLAFVVNNNLTVTDNTISNGLTANGLVIHDVSNSSFMDNFVFNNSIYGIYSHTQSKNNVINNNEVSNNLRGIYFIGVNNTVVSNNNVYNHVQHGIQLSQSYNNTINGNSAYSNTLLGIGIYQSDNNQIIENHSYLNGWDGISLNDGSDNNNVTGNMFYENTFKGIYMNVGTGNLFANNIIHDNEEWGIIINIAPDNIFLENVLTNDGMMLFASGITNLRQEIVANNTVNGKPLVFLQDETSVWVEEAGQVIILGGSYHTVAGHNLSDTDIGVVAMYTHSISIYNNSFINTESWGVYLSTGTSDSFVMFNNFIQNNINGTSQATDHGTDNLFSNNYYDTGARIDFDDDGIVEVPFIIRGDAHSRDYFPLMFPFGTVASYMVGAPILLSPNGGEILNGSVTIQWKEVTALPGIEVTYDLYYSSDAGENWELLANELTTTSYQWETVLFEDGDNYLLKVVASNSISDITVEDISDDFIEISNGDESLFGAIDRDQLPLILAIGGVVGFGVILTILRRRRGSS